MCRITAEFL
ncbi:hypothetical protein PhCBS80983_g03843 [Powellomyces hirtus]|uniref:Uncharacterized protein n=1 Tax=Powellomyces hirtus TaxID=109895 RepID=A0A507E0W8_9FUNG|nr:hypothetical protein PhCBS80983_g03843 [Powellomyces hirtus]